MTVKIIIVMMNTVTVRIIIIIIKVTIDMTILDDQNQQITCLNNTSIYITVCVVHKFTLMFV